jgi:hypothetical protein
MRRLWQIRSGVESINERFDYLSAQLGTPVIVYQPGEQFQELFTHKIDVVIFEGLDPVQVELNTKHHAFLLQKPSFLYRTHVI